MTRGKRVIGPEARQAMKQILADIQSGKFADEWMDGVPSAAAALPRAAQGSGDTIRSKEVGDEAARHDAVARLGASGRPVEELTVGRCDELAKRRRSDSRATEPTHDAHVRILARPGRCRARRPGARPAAQGRLHPAQPDHDGRALLRLLLDHRQPARRLPDRRDRHHGGQRLRRARRARRARHQDDLALRHRVRLALRPGRLRRRPGHPRLPLGARAVGHVGAGWRRRSTSPAARCAWRASTSSSTTSRSATSSGCRSRPPPRSIASTVLLYYFFGGEGATLPPPDRAAHGLRAGGADGEQHPLLQLQGDRHPPPAAVLGAGRRSSCCSSSSSPSRRSACSPASSSTPPPGRRARSGSTAVGSAPRHRVSRLDTPAALL